MSDVRVVESVWIPSFAAVVTRPPTIPLACLFLLRTHISTDRKWRISTQKSSNRENQNDGKPNRLALFYITKNGHHNNGYHICDKMWFGKSCLYWEWMPSHCHQCTTIFYQNLRGKLLLKTALRIHKEAKVQRCQGFVYFITFPLIFTKCQTLKTQKEP